MLLDLAHNAVQEGGGLEGIRAKTGRKRVNSLDTRWQPIPEVQTILCARIRSVDLRQDGTNLGAAEFGMVFGP